MNLFCEEVHKLEAEFKQCRKLLNAIGDENRQHLICVMMNMPIDGGRVVEIVEQTHLSRPAVPHHMQILKDVGIIKSRKEGTQVSIHMIPKRDEEGVAVK